MDEVVQSKGLSQKLSEKIGGLFVVQPVIFSNKSQINLRGIAWLSSIFMGLFCVGVFLVPTPREETRTYSERRADPRTSTGSTVTDDPVRSNNPLSAAAIQSYGRIGGSTSNGGYGSKSDRNSAMIVVRESDPSTTLPPGTTISIKLTQNATVAAQPIPVIGRIATSVVGRSSVAIAEDSQIFGEAKLDPESERVNVNWKSVRFPDGRSKSIVAMAIGADNQSGVEGEYHSDAFKNTTGQMISRFVGGFAEGSLNRGPLGANPGGLENGILTGVSETAKDRTEAWSADLKKPKAWVDLKAGTELRAILMQPFLFRDPGGVN